MQSPSSQATPTSASTKIDDILDTIGRTGVSSPAEWAAIALECLDQAMLPCGVQDQIAEIIRRAGADVGGAR